jgi:MFS family permease
MSIGLVLQSGSFLLASFATKVPSYTSILTQIWQLFLTQGAMFGAGMGLLFVAAAPLPNQWFNKRRALAMGICAAGSGAGGLLFSICTNLMIQNISLAWSFRITAITVFFVNTIVIIVLKDRIKVISARYRSFDLSLLRNMGFVSVILWGFVMLFGYVTVMFSLSDFAVSVGLSQQQGSVVTGMFSAGIMLGRPTMGFFADRIGRINLSIICTLGTAITCFVIWMFATSYGVMIFFALIHGTPPPPSSLLV